MQKGARNTAHRAGLREETAFGGGTVLPDTAVRPTGGTGIWRVQACCGRGRRAQEQWGLKETARGISVVLQQEYGVSGAGSGCRRRDMRRHRARSGIGGKAEKAVLTLFRTAVCAKDFRDCRLTTSGTEAGRRDKMTAGGFAGSEAALDRQNKKEP